MQSLSTFANSVKKATKTITHKLTPLEKNLNEAISNANWGVSNTVLYDICRLSHDYSDYYIIMQAIWDALQERGKSWRRVFKALTLLEYLIKNGSERVIDELRDGQYKIRQLQDFSHFEDGKDRGGGIKEKANQILALINDSETLHSEREKARKTRDKFVGMSSDMAGHGCGSEGFGSESTRYDSYSKRNDSHQPNSQAARGLASRLERDNENKFSSFQSRGKDRDDNDGARRRNCSDKKIQHRSKRKTSSSSSDSDSDDKKKKAPSQAPMHNLLDMGDATFGGFESATQPRAPANFDAFEFGGFASAAPAQPATSSFAAFGAPNVQQQSDFGDFVSAPTSQQAFAASAAVPDFFSAAAAPFSANQQSMVQPQQQQQQEMQRQMQQRMLQQQQMQQQQQQQLQQQQMQQQQQRLAQQQQAQQAQALAQAQTRQQQSQREAGFLNDISSHLYDLSLSDAKAQQSSASNPWNPQPTPQQYQPMNSMNQQQSMAPTAQQQLRQSSMISIGSAGASTGMGQPQQQPMGMRQTSMQPQHQQQPQHGMGSYPMTQTNLASHMASADMNARPFQGVAGMGMTGVPQQQAASMHHSIGYPMSGQQHMGSMQSKNPFNF